MSGRRSKKNQRLGSSRRGPKGLNRNIDKDDDDDDGFQQIAESGDGKNEFHTTSDYHSAQFDHPPSSTIDQQTSALECPAHARSHKDSLMETELPEGKRKMGSTRKSAGGFKVERKLHELRTTEELDEYVIQPNISATEEQHSSLRGDEQSRSSSFPSNLSLHTESSGLGGEHRTTVMDVVSENEEKDAIHHQEITSHSYEIVSATVSESDLLREDPVMFNKLKPLSRQETLLASTTGQKRRMGSTRRPLRGKNSENVGVQEHSRSMTENERKEEVIDEAKFSMSEEMAQMWDDVVRDDPSSHTETALVSNQSLLAERAELTEPVVSAGTETINQSVTFPLVNPEKPLPETSSHNGTPLLNKGLDFKFGSHTEDFNVLNKVLEDDNQHVPDTRNDTNTSHDCRDVNTAEGKEEVLMQKEEPSRNKKTSSLSPRHDAQLEELVLNCEESPSLSQHTAQLIEGENISFDVPASNISHAEPTATNSPHEMSDALEESQEIYVEMKHKNNVCDVASITCNTLTDLDCADEDERGSETDNGFEIIDQGDARDHNVTQIIMESRNNNEDGGMSTETVSHQEPCEVSNEKEELHREREYSSTISQIQSGPPQDNAGKMLENKEVREDKGETENTIITDVTSKSEKMLSFEDSATDTGSHAHQQLFMQSPGKEGYDLSEKFENVAFDGSVGRSKETEGIEGMDASLLILEVEKPLTNVNTVYNDSESDLQTENPDQNRVLTEEQNDTSPDINQEAFQVSDNVSAVIDSSPLLHVAVGSEKTDTIAEESDISLVISEGSQDSYKLTTFHSETQLNEGDAKIVPVGRDTDLEIQTEIKSFYSSTSEDVGTEENSHDVSVLVKEFDVNGDTVTVESNRTTESDFLQTSSKALKVSENPENEVSSDINIIPEDSHREEANTKLSPVVYKRKMGSTRRPLRGDTGQRKRREYDDENETFNSESMINVEKETFSLEYEPSPDKSTSQSSKDGAKEQEMEICEKNDVGPAEGSESDLMQSSFSLDSVSEESTVVTISHITESQTLTNINEETENAGDAERVPAEGDTQTHSEIQTENKTIDLTSEAEGTEENICEATVIVNKVEVIGDTVTVDSDMTTESDFHQNASSPDAHVEDLKVSENVENKVSGETDTITEPSDINIIPEVSHRVEAHTKLSPVYKRKMGSTRRPLRGDTGQRKRREYDDENETFNSESMINVEKETFSLEDEPSPVKSTSQSSKDGAKEQEMEICEKNDVGPAEGSESDLMQSSFSLDLVSEESTAVTLSHITESQTLTKMNQESQEKTGDAERVPAEGDPESLSEIQTENKMTDLTTSKAERTEENILDATVLVREVEFTVDTVTVESNMSEFDLLQNDTFTDAKLEALKVSENTENVSSVTDTGLLVQDDATEGSGEIDTIPDQNDTIIPEDTHREAAHSKPSPIVHKRKIGSTRRPLKGNKGQRKGIKYDENETLEPSPDESMLQSSKDGAKEQEMELCEKNDFGPESDLMQSSFGLDSVSEESTAVTLSHITESQTLTKMNQESKKNSGDPERMPAEGDTESHPEIQTENKTIDLTSEAEGTEENICEATVIVNKVEVIGDTVTVDSDMTTESDFHQNASSPDAHVEDLNVSENVENKVSGETDIITEPSDINIIPEVSHRGEAHTKLSPVVYKRKMGSTRRPLRGDTGQRKRREYDDENETFSSESMINVEKETFSLEDEPSPDKSTSQSSKDGAKEQMEICEKNDVGPAEGSESDLMQSSFSLDLVSEESTVVTLSHITESQTLTKMNQESQEKTGDAERVPAEGDPESHSEIQTENKTIDLTSEAEGTEENICEATVIVNKVEVIGDTVTVDSDMTTESDFHQNASSPDAHVEDLNVSENVENKVSGETDIITEPSDINIIPEVSHRGEAHTKLSPVVYKRKMGSTRRPLRGDTGQRKRREYDDENETFSSESMINVEKETFSLEDEPSPDKSTSQSSKDGAKEQMEICEKNDVGPAEGSESDLMQSSFSLDLVSEESTVVTLSHITESQTLTKMNQESQEKTGDAERVPAEGDPESHSEIQTENKTTDLTSKAERTEENILDATVLVEEVEFTVDTVTVESNMSEFDLLQNDTFTDAKLEALKVSEHTENASSVTDTGLLVQDDATEGSGETDTIPDQNDTIIPEDTHREAAHSKPSPIVHKRKMGSTRRPLKGNKGQRKGIKYDENETLDSECTINVEKETFSLEDEPSPVKSTSQSSKDGAKEQEMEICEKNDVGPAEGSESDLMQSSFSLDSVSEESTKVTISHITESQTLTNIYEEYQDNTRDADKAAVGGDSKLCFEMKAQNQSFDSITCEAEETEENSHDASVSVREDDVIENTVTVESDMTTESVFLQSSPDVNMEALKVSENAEKEVSGETDTILKQSDTNIIPEGTHREETHSKLGPIVHKRKMGSTRRPLKGNKGQRKEKEHYDENEKHHDEREIFVLEDEPSPDESSLQSSKDGAKEQEMEIFEKNDVGPAEGSESDLMQSSFSLDLVSEESTAVTLSYITESQTLTKMNQESQDNTGDAERVPAEGDPESHSEIQTENKTIDLTSEAEGTEENICEATVIVNKVEVIGDTVTVDSDMTTKSDFHQNASSPDAHVEDLKVSENVENKVSGETDTITEPSDINIIPEVSHRGEAHTKSSPVYKRKMGSTRRPLRGDTGQRKRREYDDENETFNSESMINVEKETFSLEDEPSPDKSTSQSSKDGAKEQEMEIFEKNDVGPAEGSESDLMQSSFSLDSVSEESTVVTISHITESQTLTKMNQESQEKTGDAERVPAEGDPESHSEIQTENKTTDLTSKAERTEETILDATVLVGEVEFTVDTVTVESNMSEFDLLQNDTFTDAKLEALKVSENTENVSSVTDTGLLVQDDATEGSGETDTIPDQNDTIIPEDTHREAAHSKPSPIVHKRKMGSTRRPLKGNKGQRKGIKYDENETLEPSPDESMLQSSKDGAKEQEMELCEKNDFGPESDLMQSSFGLDSVSEESTAVTLSHITESQTLTKMNQDSQKNSGDPERMQAEGDTESHPEIQTENKTIDLTSEAEGTEENICEATVIVNKVEVIGDTVTVDSDMTTESDFHQNASSPDAHVEDLNVSENVENKVSGETDIITEPSDINIIPEVSHRVEAHTKLSPVVYKRKMGSTRRPLRGDTGQRKRREYDDENETFSSESMINVEKETFSLEDEPSPDKSTSQSSKDGAKEQMEICEKNDVGPAEGSESDLMQSSFSLDLVSEESTVVTLSHITESQTLTKMNQESQEKTGDAERVPAEGDPESLSEIQTENKTDLTSKAERTEENILDATVLVEEVEFTVDTVTVESNMSEFDLLQNYTFTDAKLEALKVSEHTENVSSVTDTGLLVQDDATEGSGETDTIPDQNDTIIPEDTHREAAHSKPSPIVHKRKMGSTRRPLKGNKGQRKGIKYDENETLDSECTINVEKETFSLEDEPSPVKSTSQSSKDGAKEQEMEICEKNDVGPAEGSESDLMQSSFSLDSVSEESTKVTISHITESQTLTNIYEEYQDNTRDADKAAVGGDSKLCFEMKAQNQSFDSITCEAEETEENSHDASVSVREDDVIENTVTVESDMTTESVFLQSSPDVNMEALKVSENAEKEVSGETDTILKQSDTNIIPEGTHREETHSKLGPIVHKRKMGSTRRPLKGNKGQRKEKEHYDENEKHHDEREIFVLEDEPSPDESSLQSSKDGAKEQEMEIFEKNDVGPAEGSESDLMQSSFSLDLVSEESTAVTLSYITESQTLTKMNQESQDNTGDVERVPAEGDTESHSEIQTENKTTDLPTSEGERTEENILDATVLVGEVEFTVDTVTVESNMSEFDLLQNDTFTDAKLEALKVSENTENVSSVTDTGLLVQDDATEGSGEIDTIPDRNDTIIPEDTHREAAHSKPSPIVHKRKMGSTRRPLKGNKGQRKGIKYDENETLEPSPDESMLQSSKDGAKEQEMELCEKNDFGPESDLMQSSFGLDSVSEESTAVTLSHITESQTLTKMNQESQKNSGDPERMPAEGDTESHPEIQTENKTIDLTSEAEGTEENICEATVIVNKVEVIGDTVTVDSDMTTESDFHQNASSPDAHVEDLKVSENVENKVSGETDIITEPSDINFIPEVSHRVEAHTKLSPVVYKRKMGSTRRPLRGNKGQRKGEEDTETLSEIQDQDNVVGHNVTQEICNIRDDEDEERMTTTLVGMSVQLCDDLKQEHRSDVSQTQTGPSQDDTERTERTASHSDLVLSDALPMEETQIHVSSEDVVMGDTWVHPAEVVEMHSVSNRSLKKRKMGSTRKRGKRMVNEEEVEEEKEGEAENTTIDDGTTKSEETLTLEEAITESLVHQQAFQQSDVQTENSENDQNQAAEIVSDLPLGDVETYSVPEQSEIISIIPEEFRRKDVQSNSIPVVQKRKMGSSRKTLKENKGQRREVESKKMDGESKGIAKEQDTDTHLAITEGENKWKLDEDVEQNFPVEFSYQAAISNMFSESEDGVKEVSLNIHDPPEVSEEKGLENTVNDSNSLNEAINLYEGTMDKFVLTVSHEDVHQTMSAEYLDQHVHGGSETEQAETMCHVFPTQELKNTQDDVVHENSSQKIPCTKEKRRKMGSTRRNPRVMHGKDMGDQDDIHGMAMERETKKAEDDLDDMPLASSISQPKEMSSEAISTTDLESEMSVSATDLKGSENDYQNNSDPSGPTGTEPPENTLQICENQLVSADVTETVTVEKRRKMGSTRKNVREGGIRGKRDAYEDTETADTHLTMSQDSEMSLVGKAVGEQTIHDQSEDSLLSEIERALNKTSQSSSNYELNVNEPNSGDLANTHLNKPENSEIKYLQPQPSQTSKTHSEPNSPERRRRKMGSTRRNPRQQLKAEREDEDKEGGEVEENSAGKKQEIKNLERVEVSVVHNIPENKLNKEYLNVPSAHTSSSQLEESGNPVVQERTSPSTKRKFGSRRTNKGKQGLGRLDASDRSELEDEVNDDLTVCDPHHNLQPENQPISKLISEQSNMEARNEEAAPKGTGAGLVSLDQIIKRDRSTGTKQTINIQNRNSEVQFNVVMVGNSCVGKTSFIRRFHEGQFTEDYRSTIGVDTCMQTVVLPDRTVKLQIWDTAGQERFHSITRQVFHKADGLLLMYEITCSKSFISVRDWISQARERAPDDAIMILLGNKNDSVEREVQIQEGVDLAREYNIHFMECSAATGANVSESMMTLAELLVQRKTRKEEHTILRREPPTKKSGCC